MSRCYRTQRSPTVCWLSVGRLFWNDPGGNAAVSVSWRKHCDVCPACGVEGDPGCLWWITICSASSPPPPQKSFYCSQWQNHLCKHQVCLFFIFYFEIPISHTSLSKFLHIGNRHSPKVLLLFEQLPHHLPTSNSILRLMLLLLCSSNCNFLPCSHTCKTSIKSGPACAVSQRSQTDWRHVVLNDVSIHCTDHRH